MVKRNGSAEGDDGEILEQKEKEGRTMDKCIAEEVSVRFYGDGKKILSILYVVRCINIWKHIIPINSTQKCKCACGFEADMTYSASIDAQRLVQQQQRFSSQLSVEHVTLGCGALTLHTP